MIAVRQVAQGPFTVEFERGVGQHLHKMRGVSILHNEVHVPRGRVEALLGGIRITTFEGDSAFQLEAEVRRITSPRGELLWGK
jgi:hypothetical protein